MTRAAGLSNSETPGKLRPANFALTVSEDRCSESFTKADPPPKTKTLGTGCCHAMARLTEGLVPLLRSQPRRSGIRIFPRSATSRGIDSYSTKGATSLRVSVTFLRDPTTPFSVTELNDLTGDVNG